MMALLRLVFDDAAPRTKLWSILAYAAPGPRQPGQAWVNRARSLEVVSNTGVHSCSAVGPAGYTGCMEQMIRDAREESEEAIQQQTAPQD